MYKNFIFYFSTLIIWPWNFLNCTSVSLLLLSFYNTSLLVTMSVCLFKKTPKNSNWKKNQNRNKICWKNICRRKENKAVMHTVKGILNWKRDFKYNFRDTIFKTKPRNWTHNMIKREMKLYFSDGSQCKSLKLWCVFVIFCCFLSASSKIRTFCE